MLEGENDENELDELDEDELIELENELELLELKLAKFDENELF
ncbi:hypothetical protein AGMMS50233_10450 [Endomicrobiia bacterium]|nr:hypothetical protein AGMMS50233_10450 [Endomicrobiia bacterium]